MLNRAAFPHNSLQQRFAHAPLCPAVDSVDNTHPVYRVCQTSKKFDLTQIVQRNYIMKVITLNPSHTAIPGWLAQDDARTVPLPKKVLHFAVLISMYLQITFLG